MPVGSTLAAAVPEPTSALLLATGLAVLLVRRRAAGVAKMAS